MRRPAALLVLSELNVAATGASASVGDGAADAKAAEFELAMELRNTIVDLATVPIVSSFEFGSGSKHALAYTLIVQPVIPFELIEN